jgi:hypothetical protein
MSKAMENPVDIITVFPNEATDAYVIRNDLKGSVLRSG